MGIKYNDFLNLSWKEFDFYSVGYQRKLERGWDYSRHLIAAMFNSSGMTKTKAKPKDVFQLPLLDNKHVTEVDLVPESTIKHLLKAARNGNN